MNKLTTIAGALLGLAFIVFGLNFFLSFIEMPGPPKDSNAAKWFGVMAPTGYMGMVKVFEIIGGILVAVPKTRNIGLLVLGPIIVNILAFNIFVAPGGLTQAPVIIISVLGAFLLWAERKSFAKLIH